MVAARRKPATGAEILRLAAEARADIAIAERDRAVSALKALLQCVDRNGFSWPGQQHAVREALAVIAESEGES